jgi:hypothetical protein
VASWTRHRCRACLGYCRRRAEGDPRTECSCGGILDRVADDTHVDAADLATSAALRAEIERGVVCCHRGHVVGARGPCDAHRAYRAAVRSRHPGAL